MAKVQEWNSIKYEEIGSNNLTMNEEKEMPIENAVNTEPNQSNPTPILTQNSETHIISYPNASRVEIILNNTMDERAVEKALRSKGSLSLQQFDKTQKKIIQKIISNYSDIAESTILSLFCGYFNHGEWLDLRRYVAHLIVAMSFIQSIDKETQTFAIENPLINKMLGQYLSLMEKTFSWMEDDISKVIGADPNYLDNGQDKVVLKDGLDQTTRDQLNQTIHDLSERNQILQEKFDSTVRDIENRVEQKTQPLKSTCERLTQEKQDLKNDIQNIYKLLANNKQGFFNQTDESNSPRSLAKAALKHEGPCS